MDPDVKLFIKELDQLVHSVSVLNAAKHQIRLQQLEVQHARRIEKLLFESWLSPHTSVQQWFDAQSDEVKEYWQGFYVLYQYNPEFHAKLDELDFIQRQVFELLQANDRYHQHVIFEPTMELINN
jgi:hypothetical protein